MRDHGDYVEQDDEDGEKEDQKQTLPTQGLVDIQNCVWLQRYRSAISIPQWDRTLTTNVLVLSKNSRWANRNGGGAFPKAITTRPVGQSARPLLLTFTHSSEFGLFSGASAGNHNNTLSPSLTHSLSHSLLAADVMNDLNAKAAACHWHSSRSLHPLRGESVMNDLNAKAAACHWPDAVERFANDCVFFSKMGRGFRIRLNGKVT